MDQLQRFFIFLWSWRKIRTIAWQLRLRGFPVELARGLLRILGDIHEDRAGAARAGYIECFAHRLCQFIGPRYQIIVLGNGQSNACDVGFLKGIGADQFAAHLTGDANNGGGVQHRGRDAGHHVGGSRTGGRHGDPYSSAGARVAVRHVRGALLMPHQHVMDLAVLQGIVSRQDGAAGISEDVGHAFPLQAFPKNLRSSFRHSSRFL
jgi:hypothetical protein